MDTDNVSTNEFESGDKNFRSRQVISARPSFLRSQLIKLLKLLAENVVLAVKCDELTEQGNLIANPSVPRPPGRREIARSKNRQAR